MAGFSQRLWAVQHYRDNLSLRLIWILVILSPFNLTLGAKNDGRKEKFCPPPLPTVQQNDFVKKVLTSLC